MGRDPLAGDARRSRNIAIRYFRNELLVALKILQDGHIARETVRRLLGRRHGPDAVHADQLRRLRRRLHRRRQAATSGPTCRTCSASTANYFSKARGWKRGMPWGFEVIVPKGFDLMKSRATLRGMDSARRQARRRQALSRRPATASCSFPTGVPARPSSSRANFDVIKDYNNSDVYALAIGHLADLMQGGGPFKTPWPAQATPAAARRPDRLAEEARRARLRPDALLPPTSISRCATSSAPSRRSIGLVTGRSSERGAAGEDGRQAAAPAVDVSWPVSAVSRAMSTAAGVLGLQPRHIEDIAQRIEAVAPGDDQSAQLGAQSAT